MVLRLFCLLILHYFLRQSHLHSLSDFHYLPKYHNHLINISSESPLNSWPIHIFSCQLDIFAWMSQRLNRSAADEWCLPISPQPTSGAACLQWHMLNASTALSGSVRKLAASESLFFFFLFSHKRLNHQPLFSPNH